MAQLLNTPAKLTSVLNKFNSRIFNQRQNFEDTETPDEVIAKNIFSRPEYFRWFILNSLAVNGKISHHHVNLLTQTLGPLGYYPGEL